MFQSDDWLFINKIIVKIGNQQYIFSGTVKSDNTSSTTYEWIDETVTPELLEKIVKEYENNGNIKIRFVGETYHSDFEFSNVQISGIKNFLKYYASLQQTR
jgi:hypothetical protein